MKLPPHEFLFIKAAAPWLKQLPCIRMKILGYPNTEGVSSEMVVRLFVIYGKY